MAELQHDQQRAEKDELAEARRELDDFRTAMSDVHNRGGPQHTNEVPYDSGQTDQNRSADVLIQYLVRPGYAEVRTEEAAPERYVYHIRVDWPRLRTLAEAQGHPLAL
jgi:hypothetical protein